MGRIKKLVVLLIVVIICNFMGTMAFALPFQNGDFSSGFTGWQGDAGGTLTDPASGSLFSISADQSALVQSDLVLFPITLFQNFTLSPTATILSFSFVWQPSSANEGDFVTAMLQDQAGIFTPIDLFDGKDPLVNALFSANVSSLAGQDVQIYFSLFDLSYDPESFTSDVMKIDNISIAQADSSAPVPEPGTIYLVGAGLAGIALARRRKKGSF